MKTLIILLVIVLVVVGAYYLFFRNDTQTIENIQGNSGPRANSGLTVVYTDSGFSPQALTVNEGETVTFVNQSSSGMWVASDPHPTHTNYPEFDEDAAASNGQNWTFTFNRVGSWGYHNHQSASSTGTIVVE